MKKIVLLCAAGMSTSMLVNKMREAAVKMNYECIINAYPLVDAEAEGANADVVLLGPQVRFQLKNVVNQVKCPVEAIDMTAYGTMNGEKVIQQVKKILGE
jgi:PTS system cellobiose-specific IIB component